MASATEGSNPGDQPTDPSNSSENGKDEKSFECNICLDTARDAVVSLCGHLFCWPCLHQWLETRPNRQVCPVCKAGINKQKVIPLYGRGNTKQEDPRDKLPPRPPGQRTEPENNGTFPGFSFGDGGFHMSFGIGAFPFGFISSTFNFGENRPTVGAAAAGADAINNEFLSKTFLWVAILFIFWLLIA